MSARIVRSVPRCGRERPGERERTVRSRPGRLGNATPQRVPRKAVVTERSGSLRWGGPGVSATVV